MKKLLLGLIGAGIQRSMSPALHEEEGRHHGLRVHYQLIDLDAAGVGPQALPELVRAARVMGFAGLNITFPCKQAIIPLLPHTRHVQVRQAAPLGDLERRRRWIQQSHLVQPSLIAQVDRVYDR